MARQKRVYESLELVASLLRHHNARQDERAIDRQRLEIPRRNRQ